MLKLAIMFLVIALVSGALGFGTVAGAAASIAKALFVIFLAGFLITLILAIVAARKIKTTMFGRRE
jgi:uncharacterized membrane protein YtjA (UPF0391 family)